MPQSLRQRHLLKISVFILIIVLIGSFPISAQSIYLPTQIAWSPDGNSTAGIDKNGSVRIWDANTGALRFHIDTAGIVQHSLSWSAQSNLLATSGETDGIMHLWDVSTGQSVVEMQVGTRTDIDFSADGTLLAAITPNSESADVQLWSVQNITFEPLQPNIHLSFYWLTWNHNGSQLAAFDYRGMFLVDIARAPFKLELRTLSPQLVLAVSWKPGDQQLAIAGLYSWIMVKEDAADDQIEILDVHTGNTLMTIEDRGYHFENVQWSPDGKLIAGISVTKIAFWDADTGQPVNSYFRLRTSTAERTYTASWSPFGGRLAFVGYIPTDSPQAAYTLEGSLVQIVVPAPSQERLKMLMQQCVMNLAQRTLFNSQLESGALDALVDDLRSSEDIPPACSADLIAIATALHPEM